MKSRSSVFTAKQHVWDRQKWRLCFSPPRQTDGSAGGGSNGRSLNDRGSSASDWSGGSGSMVEGDAGSRWASQYRFDSQRGRVVLLVNRFRTRRDNPPSRSERSHPKCFRGFKREWISRSWILRPGSLLAFSRAWRVVGWYADRWTSDTRRKNRSERSLHVESSKRSRGRVLWLCSERLFGQRIRRLPPYCLRRKSRLFPVQRVWWVPFDCSELRSYACERLIWNFWAEGY